MERLRRTTYLWAGVLGLIAGAAFAWVAIAAVVRDHWVPPLFFLAFVHLLLGALFLRHAVRLRAKGGAA